MSERGVFAVDRGVWEHDLLASADPFSRREAWLWLVSEAAWKPHRRRLAGKPIDVNRGQLAASLRFIASKWRWSEPRVRRFLAVLISDQMIGAKTDAGVTVITICKYDEYQRVSLPSDATPKVDADAGATQERRKVEDKESKEDNSSLRSLGRSAAPTRPPAGASDFDEFWSKYPKREGANPKEPARKKFLAAVKSGADPTAIIRGAEAYATEQQQLGKVGTTYVAQAVTWLNQQRWRDYATGTNGPPQTGPPAHLTGAERAAWIRERMQEQANGREANATNGAGILGQGHPVREERDDRPEEPTLV